MYSLIGGVPIKTPGGLRKSFRSACTEAEIPHGRDKANGLTLHDIRRTVKTSVLNAGVDKAHRGIILGHSLKGIDVHYIAPTEETLQQAMDRYTIWLDEKLNLESIDQTQKRG